MRIGMQPGPNRAGACLLVAAVLAVPAPLWAQEPEPLPSWYLGLLGGVVQPDSARLTDSGPNAHLVIGTLLGEAAAFELNGFRQTTRRQSDDGAESSMGAGLDLVLGTPDPGSPFFLLGGGMVREEIGPATLRSNFGNLGLGLYLPFTFFGELWRLEARYNVVFNDQAAPGNELLEDVRFNLGLVFGFGRLDVPVEEAEEDLEPVQAPPPPPPPPPAPSVDADQDGVADSADACPGTPRWVRPDERGCPPDSDGDGVDETRDLCPGTPAGTNVDPLGCKPAAAAPTAAADEDGDGVPDRGDACPHTPAGQPVDGKGCVKVESVVIRNVLFPVDYYGLTPEAYRLLNAVVASLQADWAMRIEIGGHADSLGNDAYNQKLSLRRAEVVRDFLIYAGVPAAQITVRGYGEAQPVADNRTEAGRMQNRRVGFRIHASPN